MSDEFQKQITQTMYLQALHYAPTDLKISCVDMSKYGYLPYGTIEVTVDVPSDLPDPTDLRIKSLNDEYERVKNEASKKLDNIKEQIERLQAISYQSES